MDKQSEQGWYAPGNAIRLPSLSPAAASFVRSHPSQAQLVVAAALEAAAAQFGALDRVEGVAEALRPYVIDASAASAASVVIGADEAAQRLGVTRATVYNWIQSKRLIGWRLTRLGTLIPAEQIIGAGELVAGIDRVLAVIPEARSAWRFLDEESPHFDRPQRPIDALKMGNVDEVVSAASASGEAFT